MLNALVAAQDALARLEASAEAASAQVREGLLNRLTYREIKRMNPLPMMRQVPGRLPIGQTIKQPLPHLRRSRLG